MGAKDLNNTEGKSDKGAVSARGPPVGYFTQSWQAGLRRPCHRLRPPSQAAGDTPQGVSSAPQTGLKA